MVQKLFELEKSWFGGLVLMESHVTKSVSDLYGTYINRKSIKNVVIANIVTGVIGAKISEILWVEVRESVPWRWVLGRRLKNTYVGYMDR